MHKRTEKNTLISLSVITYIHTYVRNVHIYTDIQIKTQTEIPIDAKLALTSLCQVPSFDSHLCSR